MKISKPFSNLVAMRTSECTKKFHTTTYFGICDKKITKAILAENSRKDDKATKLRTTNMLKDQDNRHKSSSKKFNMHKHRYCSLLTKIKMVNLGQCPHHNTTKNESLSHELIHLPADLHAHLALQQNYRPGMPAEMPSITSSRGCQP